MSRIVDNKIESLQTRLNEVLPECIQLDACVGYFNLRGWKRIRNAILQMDSHEDRSPRVRLLIGMALAGEQEVRNEFSLLNRTTTGGVDLPKAVDLAKRAIAAFAEQLTWGAPTNDDAIGLRQLKEDLISGRVQVKFAAKETLHAKLYVCHVAEGLKGFRATVGSSNLTAAGLSGQGELNLEESDESTTLQLAEWFNLRWFDEFSIDITELLAEVLETSWAREVLPDPRSVHLKLPLRRESILKH